MIDNMILDALVVDIDASDNPPPERDTVLLQDPATGDIVRFPVELENSITILLSVGYRIVTKNL